MRLPGLWIAMQVAIVVCVIVAGAIALTKL